MKRQIENLRRQLWLRRVCYGLVFFAAVAILLLMGFRPEQVKPSDASELSLPTSATGAPQATASSGTFHIEDVISFGTEVLFLVREPPNVKFPTKETLKCRSGRTLDTPLAVHQLRQNANLAAVVCPAPRDAAIPSLLIEAPPQEVRAPGKPVVAWNATKVVYEAFATEHDVALFVHGFDQTLRFKPTELECVFGDGDGEATPVSAQAGEVVRCGHPPAHRIAAYAGTKLSLRYGGELLPTVAYYNPREPRDEAPPTQHHVCACTMVYNGAKFLREWVFYHSHLGVEKFIFYDNNSDDNLEDVIAGLAQFNVTKHPWPWVKTQEAAFSHCTLLAKRECTWMLFTDIDEYFFPSERFLQAQSAGSADAASPGYKRSTPSAVARFVEESVAAGTGVEVGQISIYCRNFGPSGLAASPREGVTQGYTCRVQKQKRHKSVVLLRAVDEALGNQVHHFSLRAAFVSVRIRPWDAIINHYKFQAWDEFKTKFHRRAATYVADWTEDRNHGSNDRVPGLGTLPVKPRDWESRYCEVRDTALRDYTRRVFGSDSLGTLAWE